MEIKHIIGIAVGVIALTYWSVRDTINTLKRKNHAALLQGRKEGMEMERKNILGNFDSTDSINKDDFLRIIKILRADGFELVYNPNKGGYDVRKHKYDTVIEVENIEI